MHGRTGYLLVSLLILIALGPWLTERPIGRGVWELLFTLVTLSSIHVVGVERGQALISTLLALPTLASLWLRQVVPGVHLSQVALVLLTLFLLYTTVTVLLRVFAEETVTIDTLSAALCVYLLMGYMWGSLYGLIYLQTPSGFHLPTGWTPASENGIATDVPLRAARRQPARGARPNLFASTPSGTSSADPTDGWRVRCRRSVVRSHNTVGM